MLTGTNPHNCGRRTVSTTPLLAKMIATEKQSANHTLLSYSLSFMHKHSDTASSVDNEAFLCRRQLAETTYFSYAYTPMLGSVCVHTPMPSTFRSKPLYQCRDFQGTFQGTFQHYGILTRAGLSQIRSRAKKRAVRGAQTCVRSSAISDSLPRFFPANGSQTTATSLIFRTFHTFCFLDVRPERWIW